MRSKILFAIIGLVVAMMISLALGASSFPPSLEVLINIRLPRVAAAILAGASLSTAGMLMQMTLRNPLAEAGTVGIGPAAAVGGALGTIAWQEPFTLALLIALGFSLALVKGSGLNTPPTRILILGVGLNAIMLSLLGLVSALGSRGDLQLWTFGSTTNAEPKDSLILAGALILVGFLLRARLRDIEILSLGYVGATGMGVDVRKTTYLAMMAAALLIASAVAAVGLVALLGLAVPYFTRGLVGPSLERGIYLNALIGATTLVLADLISRIAAAPIELPLAAMVALVSIPALVAAVKQVTT